MNYLAAKKYLSGKEAATLDTPFGPDILVFKVMGKMFATLSESRETGMAQMNLKCDPEEAIGLRDLFAAISPGYHMNKRHWNTLQLDNSIPLGEIKRQIDQSHLLVAKGLTRAQRDHLKLHYPKLAL